MYFKQVKTDLPITIIADTADNKVHTILIPLAFEFINRSDTARSVGSARYYFHEHDSLSIFKYKPLEGWLSNGLFRAEIDNKLVRVDGRDIRQKISVKDGQKSKVIFFPQKRLDTTQVTQDIFKDHLVKMKSLGQDTLSLGSASKFFKKEKDLANFLFAGDSIAFRIYKGSKIETFMRLPIHVIPK